MKQRIGTKIHCTNIKQKLEYSSFIVIKGANSQEDITIINVFVPLITYPQKIIQNLTLIKGKNGKCKIIKTSLYLFK